MASMILENDVTVTVEGHFVTEMGQSYGFNYIGVLIL